jgi:serpin B
MRGVLGKISRSVAFVAGTALSAGCATTFDASSPAGAVQATNRFGFELYTNIKTERANLICSPAGAAIAMSMASAGARGTTLAEMTKVLHVDPTQLAKSHASFGSLLETLNARDGQEGVRLRVADRLWGDENVDFEGDFLALLRGHYRAPLETVDFVDASEDARIAINRWGAEQTHGLIRDVVPSGAVHSKTRLVITNAVYFKGAWEHPFAPEATREEPFRAAAGPTPIQLMAQRKMLRHASTSGVSLVELPYKGGLSMVVFLSDELDGLEALERRLSENYDDWVSALTVKRVDLWLPRFRVTSRVSLGDALKTMGMPSAFDRSADFTGMARRRPNDEPIAIDNVFQQAFVEVDEVGTEAAAVTAVMIAEPTSARADEPERVVFRADHPFAYVIRDMKTGVVLFAGRVIDPATAK